MAENVISFVEQGDKYVAEVSVSADFNIHIERTGQGFLNILQRTTAEGAYDTIKGLNVNYLDPVVDYDFTGVIYPKYIKIVSKVQPTKAVITSAGEVTEIKQSNLKEGDVLYYKIIYYEGGWESTIVKSDKSGLVDGITQLAVSNYSNAMGSTTYNKFWDSWSIDNYGNVNDESGDYYVNGIKGFKFVVGSDKLSFFDAALAQTGASVEDKYVEITAEEYANIFNV